MFVRSLCRGGGKDARVTLVESHDGRAGADYQVNAVARTRDRGGRLRPAREGHREGAARSTWRAFSRRLGANATFNDFSFIVGGSVVRNQMALRFDGEGTVAAIGGASLLTGSQHVDTTLVADHAVGGCQTRELFKSVLDGEAKGVFQGKIIVRPDAQQTDAKMMSQALVLSETRRPSANPNSRSSPTTCSAVMAPPRARSTRTRGSI